MVTSYMELKSMQDASKKDKETFFKSERKPSAGGGEGTRD